MSERNSGYRGRPESIGQESPSIAFRLSQAEGRPLGLTKLDFAQELFRITRPTIEDRVGDIRELYDALLSWSSQEELLSMRVHRRVTQDLDEAAQYADALVKAEGNPMEAYEVLERVGDAYVGPIRGFYRDAVGYAPPPPRSGYPLIS